MASGRWCTGPRTKAPAAQLKRDAWRGWLSTPGFNDAVVHPSFFSPGRRKTRPCKLTQHVDVSKQNFSLLKSGRMRVVRFDTLERLCEVLRCQTGDLLRRWPTSEN
ncbi:helix-turn-helix domain-containing protein [Variovorax paradoxus]|uniref:helix-turn-helix domain-containing protein n=1 Tax=Variovorax paradoxus TaxID=34073 RepID=UPI003D661694